MDAKDFSRRDFIGAGALAIGAAGLAASKVQAADSKQPPPDKILSYNEKMEYRRAGKTNFWVSAVSLGGHWKRCPFQGEEFDKNRTEIIARCLESGINYVDACTGGEVAAYSKAIKTLGKRDKIHLGCSHYEHEVRNEKFRTKKLLMATLDETLKANGLEYVDVWRITCLEPGGLHDFNTSCEIAAAGEQAVKDGKARAFGISSHDRRWLEFMVRGFPNICVVLTPYTAKTKEKPQGSFFDTLRKEDVGFFGIKPFASNSIFKGNSTPNDPNREEDDKTARLALRYILCCDAISAPIPGLIFPHHVDNVLKAIEERRKEDLAARPGILDEPGLARIQSEMFQNLPSEYQWLKDWEWV